MTKTLQKVRPAYFFPSAFHCSQMIGWEWSELLWKWETKYTSTYKMSWKFVSFAGCEDHEYGFHIIIIVKCTMLQGIPLPAPHQKKRSNLQAVSCYIYIVRCNTKNLELKSRCVLRSTKTIVDKHFFVASNNSYIIVLKLTVFGHH